MGHSKSWKEGFETGYDWYVSNSGSACEQKAGIAIPNKPQRSGDDKFNQGVADGIAQARRDE